MERHEFRLWNSPERSIGPKTGPNTGPQEITKPPPAGLNLAFVANRVAADGGATQPAVSRK